MVSAWRFETDCVHSDSESITAMCDAAVEITFRTMARHVGPAFVQRQAELHYDTGSQRGGLRMSKDWHVSYHQSTYQGRPCFFFRWSHIEQIFTKEQEP